MTPRVSEAHLRERRREILTAAFRCFALDGLHGTTMQDIATEAGLSTGALYSYFDGKQALVRALAGESAARREDVFRCLEFGGGPDRLAEPVCEMMGELSDDEAPASVRLDIRLWAELLDESEGRQMIAGAFASLLDPVARFVDVGQAAGRVRDDVDPQAIGRVVVSLLTGLELQLAYDPDLNLDAYRSATRALLSGLGTDRWSEASTERSGGTGT